MTSRGALAPVHLAAWTAGLVVAGRLLLAAGAESLAVPLTSLDDLSVWVSATPPADMAIGVLRLAALGAVAYLLAATVLTVAAGLVGARPLVAAADLLSPAVVRRLATGGSGIGLVLGGAVAAVPMPELGAGRPGGPVAFAAGPTGPEAAPDAPTATMARRPAATATATMTAHGTGVSVGPAAAPHTAAPPQVGEATMVRVDEPAPSAAMTRLPDPGTAAPAAATSAAPATLAPAADPATPRIPGTPAILDVDPGAWVVAPGESLWSIAEDVVTPPDGTVPGERTVARYWQRLAAANRDDLVDPGNPDLLVPGQRLVLPPTDG